MQEFFQSYSFIVSFSVLVLLFNALFGDKFTEYFLLLVLASMVVLNADKFTALVKSKTMETEG